LTLLPKILAKTWPVFAFMVTHRTAPFNQQLCMNPGKWRLRWPEMYEVTRRTCSWHTRDELPTLHPGVFCAKGPLS
jgi:hypothetical protein